MDPQNPIQPTSPQQEIPQPQIPTNRARILIIVLLAVFLLSVVGIGAYFLGKRDAESVQTTTNSVVEATPISTLDPTANWKTYQNSLGFSLKYPQDKLIACSPTGDLLILWEAPFNCPEGHDALYDLRASIESNYEGYGTLVGTEKINVDGVDATKYSYIYTEEHGPLAGEESIDVVVPYKNRFILVTFFTKTLEKKERFKQILSTFKFTD